jgi:hypothetical protein
MGCIPRRSALWVCADYTPEKSVLGSGEANKISGQGRDFGLKSVFPKRWLDKRAMAERLLDRLLQILYGM